MTIQAIDPQTAPGRLLLLPDPKRFLIRAGIWTFLALVVLAIVLSRRAHDAVIFVVFFAIAAGVEWLMLKYSSITLDDNGFEYRLLGRRHAYRWADIDSFCVVSQRVLGFIKVSEFLGWHFSPESKHYKLAITRFLARAVGMADGMMKMPGFRAREIAVLMNDYLLRAKTATSQESLVASDGRSVRWRLT